MKDWLVFTILGVIIGLLTGYLWFGKSTYVDPIVIKTTKWEKKLVDNPYPVYITQTETVAIHDTVQFGTLPMCYMRTEEKIPFSVNDSNFALPFAIKTHYKGWIRDMSIETYDTKFLYEVKLKKQVDWKWCFLSFAVGALAMRGVDALVD
jgi:hypothetical protein